MLTKVDPGPREVRGASAAGVEILSVTSAVPAFKVTQDEVAWRAQKVYPQYARLDALYTNTGIETRYVVRAARVVPRAAQLGGAHRFLPAPCAWTCSRRSRVDSVEAAGLLPSDIDVHRRQHDHRARRAEPRCAPHEPPALQADRRAPADLRPRLRRRRRRAGALRPHGSSPAGLARAVPDDRSLLALPARQRSLARHVRLGGAVRRRRRRRRAAQRRRRRDGQASPAAAASARAATTSGATPSTSWAGTSRTTASASC